MDELWDEAAIAHGGASEGEVGAALLMADLETAISAAGDEIAALRRVTDATPRPALPPAPLRSEEAVASPGELVDRAVASPAAAPARDDGRGASSPVTAQDLPRTNAGAAVPDVAFADGLRTDDGATAPTIVLPAGDRGFAGVGSGSLGASRPGGSRESELPAEAEGVPPASAGLTPVRPMQVAEWSGLDAREGAQATSAPASTWAVADAPVPSSARLMEPEGDEQPSSWLGRSVGGQAAPVAATVGAGATVAAASAQSFEGIGPEARDGGPAPQGGARAGPTEGDVYLDGERVGRWMARHLARELGGPQASGTGFDPRLGPAWPGSLHGN